jgi:hypothetical protein
MVFLDPLDRLVLQRRVEHLHRCGARATAEAFAEIGRRIGGMPAILTVLGEYERRLSPELLRSVRGDRFPRRPLRVVPR